MASEKFKLHRIGWTKAAPAPESVRVGDFIYTSSIYPIDDSGHAITCPDSNDGLPYAASRAGGASASMTAA